MKLHYLVVVMFWHVYGQKYGQDRKGERVGPIGW